MHRNTRLLEAIRRQEKLLSGIILCVLIFLIWSWVYNLTSLSAWKAPLGYGGDAWVAYAFAKAYMVGDIFPFIFKWVPHLNAPFSANWNDYPVTEDLIFAVMGWLGKLIGLFSAANVVLFFAHLLAGLSFWYVARELKYRPAFAFAGAIVYAFSHFMFARGLGHLVVTYSWHVPLLLLVTWQSYSSIPVQINTRNFRMAIVISVITGTLNPYYTGMFLQFLGIAVLLHFIRKQYLNIKFPLILIAVTAASFFLMNADTIIYAIVHGPNTQAVGRNLAALEIYALKIPELVFPPAYHAWRAWAEFGQQHYYLPAFVKGEMWSPYLGLVGLAGLAWLAVISVYRLLQGRLQLIPVQSWQVLWILLYSLLGGFNLLLGSFGFMLFRATNRYSIFILAIALLFLVRQLSRKCPEKLVLPLAFAIAVLGVWDQMTTRYTASGQKPILDLVQSDKNFANKLENQLPKGSMVFQLPVAAFPEIGPINRMADYEHFRPYLFTQNLHYSYGTNKGRGDSAWQLETAKLSPADMAEKLESYGFGAIIINRKGYEDNGNSIINDLASSNRSVITETWDLVAIKLKPSTSPAYPDSGPIFNSGWSEDEKTHRWSNSSHAQIIIFNYSGQPRPATIEFTLSTLKPRSVKVALNGKMLSEFSIGIHSAASKLKPTPVILSPGKNVLSFETDVPPDYPGNGDFRKLSFQISNFFVR